MSEASKLIADSLESEYFKTVVINGNSYAIFNPTIKVIRRIVSALDDIDLKHTMNTAEVIGVIAKESDKIINAIAVAIIGDSFAWRWRSKRLANELEASTPKELNDAFQAIVNLIQGKDFFDCATLAQEVAKMTAKQK